MKSLFKINCPIKKTWLSLLILFICCSLAFWPLTFNIFSLKNDALNYFLPVRYQISEAISNGYWPFWTPYLNLGYPLHGDMQSGVWNPFVQIFSLFGPYTLKTLQYETLFYVYVSGVGMYFLTKYFIDDWKISLFTATAYMLCGFNSDSAQFLNWISGASFLPLAFLFYYRTITEQKLETALCCAIFMFLLFTTSYPADFILTCYLLFFVAIWYFFQKQFRTKNALWQLLKLHLLITIFFLLFSLPAIISYAEFLPLTERGSGATYNEVMSNPLHPSLLFSWLTPLPIWRANFANITDPLERNSYFGLITFAFLLLSFFLRINRPLAFFFKWGFIVSVLFSFGEWGGLRVIGYYALPLMNTFRHPANAKLFSIFFACMLTAFTFKTVSTEQINNSVRKIVWTILIVYFTGLLIWSLSSPISFPSLYKGYSLKSLLDSLSFSDLLLLNIILQTPFIILLYYAFVKRLKPVLLVTAGLLNCAIHTALFQPFTVVKKDTVTTIQKVLDKVQQPGYRVPDLNSSISDNSKNGYEFFKEIGAANMYNKEIGRIDYRITPSNLLTQNEFWFNKKLRTTLLQYPLLYKPDTAIFINDSSLIRTDKHFVLIEDEQTLNFINQSQPTLCSAKIQKFTPNKWELEMENNKPGFYSIFQNYYPRWQILVDGKVQKLQRSNLSFMGFQVPAGKHKVVFEYRYTDLKIAFYISITALFLTLLLLLKSGRKKYFFGSL